MKPRTDYTQLATKLDYTALGERLEQLTQRQPPRNHKTAADVLAPLRDQLLLLRHKGWRIKQLSDELKAAGLSVSPSRLSRCLKSWTTSAEEPITLPTNRRSKRTATSARRTLPVTDAKPDNDDQANLKLPSR